MWPKNRAHGTQRQHKKKLTILYWCDCLCTTPAIFWCLFPQIVHQTNTQLATQTSHCCSSCCCSLSWDHSVYAPSQWEIALQCNAISHWLGAHTEWTLSMPSVENVVKCCYLRVSLHCVCWWSGKNRHCRKDLKTQCCLVLKMTGSFFFKTLSYFLILYTISAIFLYETGPIQWMFNQHCGCW